MKIKGKKYPKVFVDLLIWTLAAPLAYSLRLDTNAINFLNDIIIYTYISIPFKFGIIYFMSFYRQTWNKVGISDLKDIILGVLAFSVISWISIPFLKSAIFIPLSIPLIEALLGVIGLSAVRVLSRIHNESQKIKQGKFTDGKSRNVLIVGAGETGSMIVREMLRHPESGLKPVGFLDDDPVKVKTRINGISVYGSIDRMKDAISSLKANELLIAMPSATGSEIRRVVSLARTLKIEHRIIPAIHDLLSGKIGINQIRELKIEDLLRRRPVKLDTASIESYLLNKRILVTGAGGSIGSEIVRQISNFKPSQMILLGRGENSIYQLDQEIKRKGLLTDYVPIITDVNDYGSLEHVFQKYRPQVIFHAAAHKHVPLMEGNPSQAILNNVRGTKNLVDLSIEYDVERFVNISTDKAVNPTSVMGASKRVAESIVLIGAIRSKQENCFVSVRFGNVLGSRGSVIPLFTEQIKNGGPVTVTHQDMTRYFMTIPEASQLVLQSASLGENGKIYVLDMGEPVKIIDLAKDLIQLLGFEPEVDIRIKVTGVRPGEKLYEEILTAEEGTTSSKHEKIYRAKNVEINVDEFQTHLDELFMAVEKRDETAIRNLLKMMVPTYVNNKLDNPAVL